MGFALHRLVLAAATIAFFVPSLAGALTYSRESFEQGLTFSLGASALPEAERAKAASLVESLRRADLCPLEVVFVHSYAIVSEGDDNTRLRLAEARAGYVKSLLALYGVPQSVLSSQTIAYPTAQAPNGLLVQIDAIGRTGTDQCALTQDSNGFRIPTVGSSR